jgi:hypothetical protein
LLNPYRASSYARVSRLGWPKNSSGSLPKTILRRLLLFVVLTCVVTWSFWELGAELFRRLRSPSALNLDRFRISLFYILGYIAVIIWFPSDEFLLNNYTPAEYGWRWAIWPIGLGFIYCLFYGLFFLSKATSLLRKEAGVDEPMLINMLLFWFFPIGIFLLQPRFVELLSRKSTL